MVYLSVKEAAELEKITDRALRKRIQNQKLVVREIKSNVGRGGVTYEVALTSLSADAQKQWWAQHKEQEPAAISLREGDATDAEDMQEELKKNYYAQRALACPMGMRAEEWVRDTAKEAGVSDRTLYRWMKNYKAAGTVILDRKNRTDRGSMRSWDGGAEDIFRALAMEFKKMSIQKLYEKTVEKAQLHDMKVGSLRTAYRLYEEMGVAADIFRKKGWRGIDVEVLPPILRDYRDLQVNDIWVGDQHTFNWFVLDEYTGRVLRLQGYMWQDLRSRAIMGIVLAPQYDAWSIGLALRDGILQKIDRVPYGKPRCVYTDWGKPERAQYLNSMKNFRIDVREVDEDFEQFVSPFTTEETGVYDELSIGTRKAIVRNSKAKLIERTFGVFEQLLKDEGLVGYAGNKAGSLTDADKEDLKRLKLRGELMTVRQFAEIVRSVAANYNARAHRGYGMLGMSPNEVFEAAVAKGYKPITIDKKQADIIFMKSAKRRVAPAGVRIDGEWWHDMDKMVRLVKQWVEVRWVPYSDEVLIFHNGQYICAAPAYQRGSMVNEELTGELMAGKKRLARNIRKELAIMTVAKEDYQDVIEEETVRKAVTRFDHMEKEKKPKAKKAKKPTVDMWKILAETNRNAVFNNN